MTWWGRLFTTRNTDVRDQLAAVDALSRIPVDPDPKKETTPTYELEATASRQTTPDTTTTTSTTARSGHRHTYKENTMTALHNRALALKLAVEATSSPEENAYGLLDEDGDLDRDYLRGVLALADEFVTYLGADEPSTGVPSGDSTPQQQPRQGAPEAIAAIRTYLEGQRDTVGSTAVDAALGQIGRLRDATSGGSYNSVIDVAIEFVGREGRAQFGAITADAIAAGLRSLRR